MNVYVLKFHSEFESVDFVSESDYFDTIPRFNGTPISNWQPIKLESVKDFGEHLKGDFLRLISSSDILILSLRAASELGELLQGNGQLLPVKVDQLNYLAFNVTNVLDALDIDKSDFQAFPSGKIFHIGKFAFNASKIPENTVLFKMSQNPRLNVLVTQRFVDAVMNVKLEGVDFEKVWSSDENFT